MAKYLKIFLVIVLLSSPGIPAFSNEGAGIDSLLSLLENSARDTNRVMLYIDIANEYMRSNPEEAFIFTQKAINLSARLHFKRGKAEGLNMLGSYYYQRGDFVDAAKSFQAAADIFSEIMDSEGLAICYNNIGGIKLKLGYYKDALNYYIKSAEIFEAMGETYGAVTLYNNIAVICRRQGDLDNASRYYQKALGLSNNLDDDDELISGILHNIGSVKHDQGEDSLALEYLQKAYKIRCRNGDSYGMALTAQSLGTVYLNTGKPENAFRYLHFALTRFKELGDLHGTADCYNKIAVYHFRHKNLSESRNYLIKSYQIGEKLGSLPVQQFALGWLASLDSLEGNLAGALKYFKAYKTISDSILTDDKRFEIAKMRMNYEKDRLEREKQIELLLVKNSLQESTLKKNRYLILSVIIGFLFCFTSGLTIFQRHRHRVQKKILELELDKLRQQLDPHFLFNSLNSIQSYIFQGDKSASNEYLTKLVKLMRLMLSSAREKTISLHEEIEFLSFYLDLMKLRYKNKFDYEFIIDECIDIQSYKIPTLILQPYIENCVIHGLKNKEGKGKIHIAFLIEHNHLHCKIEDNGTGREITLQTGNRSDIAEHCAYGTKINEDRIKLLNCLYGKGLGIKYSDLTDRDNKPAGTRVELDLPIIMN